MMPYNMGVWPDEQSIFRTILTRESAPNLTTATVTRLSFRPG